MKLNLKVFYFLLTSSFTPVLSQLYMFEPFEDCSQSSWVTIQENPHQSTWNCATEFEELAIRLIGDQQNFDIWLVSPKINFTNTISPYFIFKYKNRIVNGDLELLYSESYTGVNNYDELMAAEWESIPISMYPIGDDSGINNFIHHPAIDLSSLVNKSVHLAFRFRNSEGMYEILLDDFEVGSDYYTEIWKAVDSGSECADLKSKLSALIQDHRSIPYSSAQFDVWDSHFTTDLRMNDQKESLIIWDMYSDVPDGPEAYEYTAGADRDFGEEISEEGLYYNREHSFPKSWWGGSQDSVQFTDIHFIIPTDKVVNSIRLNYPYGETEAPEIVTTNGSMLGISDVSDYSDYVFEPIDEYKGDIARMQLYVATRYEYQASAWADRDYRGSKVLVEETYPFYEDWYVQLLIKWHEEDPVSTKERDRNNAVFAIQKNRNPFIDHPEYVAKIWGTQHRPFCEMSTPTIEEFIDNEIVIYPNPSIEFITIQTKSKINKIEVFSSLGELIMTTTESVRNLNIRALQPGMYMVKILYANSKFQNANFIKSVGI